MKKLLLLLVLVGLVSSAGCVDDSEFVTEARKANGLVIILPGIEGPISGLADDIRRGLSVGGANCALQIYPWGRPIPGIGMVLNQMDVLGNRLAGAAIANTIVEYQDKYPGRSVYIVGHSGGGGVAVFAAEGMPEGRQLDGLILLSASIWNGYDLTKALSRCRNGIANFYNSSDSGLLAIGTTITSTVDGMRGVSAGLSGFTRSFPRLYQVPIPSYGDDPHTAATRPSYVAAHVAPWVLSSGWPIGGVARGDSPPRADTSALARTGRER